MYYFLAKQETILDQQFRWHRHNNMPKLTIKQKYYLLTLSVEYLDVYSHSTSKML